MTEFVSFGSPNINIVSLKLILSISKFFALKNETILVLNPVSAGLVTIQISLNSDIEVTIYNSVGAKVST